MTITKEIMIEQLVEHVPGAVKYLMDQGIKCIACGEPVWESLEEAAKEKGFSERDIHKIVQDLQAIADNSTETRHGEE